MIFLSCTDLSNDEKAKRYFQLQDRYLSFKQQMNTSTVRHSDAIEREEINSTFPEQIKKQDSSTSKASTKPLKPFNITPKLNQPSILPKPTTLSSTPGGIKFFHPDSLTYSRNSITRTQAKKAPYSLWQLLR